MQEIKSGNLFGYVQCDLNVPEHLRAYFTKFPPISKKTVVSRNVIGDLIKKMQKKKGLYHNPGDYSYQASIWIRELSSLANYHFTCIWVLDEQKFINSLSIPQEVFQ